LLSGDNIHTIGANVSGCRMMVMDTALPGETFLYLLELAVEAGIPVCVRCLDDTIPSWGADGFKGIFMTVMSVPLAQKLLNTSIRDINDGIKACREINRMGAGNAVIVVPDNGVAMTGQAGTINIPYTPTHLEAGEPPVDLLAAGLVAGFLKGYDCRRAVRLAMGIATGGGDG